MMEFLLTMMDRIDNDEAVSFGCGYARVLEGCILGLSPAAAAAAAAVALRDPSR